MKGDLVKKLLTLTAAAILCMATAVFAADQIDLEKGQVLDKAGKVMTTKSLFADKVTAVAFAQTACANCRDEILFLVASTKDYPKLQLVVDIVDMRANEARIDSYLGELNFPGVPISDPKFTFAGSVGVNQTPSLILVDKTGKIVFRSSGYDQATGKKIAEALKGLTF
jgi:thioredoxin-related protein